MSKQAHAAMIVDEALDPLTRYQACKAMARGYADVHTTDSVRLDHARAFCVAVVGAFWATLCEQHQTRLKIKTLSMPLPVIAIDARRLAEDAGRLIAGFPVDEAGYLIGSIYTVMLPASLRSEMGAYYTPPPLVARLLDLADRAGFDWVHGSAIDPACGGGAFLAPLALRMIEQCGDASPAWILKRLGKRLKGLEIDPFAAWMARVLLEAAVLPLCIAAKQRMVNVVEVGNALHPHAEGKYDLVIGNPPYRRVTLDETMRRYYSRSLYGHANLYGLFTDLALHLLKPNGVLAYLTPTSFLGGQYFKALRELLTSEMTPLAFDFVSDRYGVFDDVLQETLLAAYIKNIQDIPAIVSAVIPRGLDGAHVEPLGAACVDKKGNPWLLPRQESDVGFLDNMTQMPNRLTDFGYVVSTGPLVWNRHKSQLRMTAECGALPLLWAESVTQAGFSFSADRRNHMPYIHIKDDQPHLVTRSASVLVQRTTSKEQQRRLLAAVLPQSFLDVHGGVVVENHLNVIYAPSFDQVTISVATIAALLNTEVVDRAFRCISGSVAVSAYELNSLPLPDLAQMLLLQDALSSGAENATVAHLVSSFYGMG